MFMEACRHLRLRGLRCPRAGCLRKRLPGGTIDRTTVRRDCNEWRRHSSSSTEGVLCRKSKSNRPMTDVDESYVETLKQRGLEASRSGRFDEAMGLLQMAANCAVVASNADDQRVRRVMRYAYDAEIEAALELEARRFDAPAGRISTDLPLHLAILCSAVQDEDGPTVITCKTALHLRDAGFEVEVVSTETVSSATSRMAGELMQLGIPLYRVAGQTFDEKVRWLLAHFTAHPANAVLSTVQVHDLLGKLIGCIGVAPGSSLRLSHDRTVEREVRSHRARSEPRARDANALAGAQPLLRNAFCHGRGDRRRAAASTCSPRRTGRRASSCDFRAHDQVRQAAVLGSVGPNSSSRTARVAVAGGPRRFRRGRVD